jgi:hypothetical protein
MWSYLPVALYCNAAVISYLKILTTWSEIQGRGKGIYDNKIRLT